LKEPSSKTYAELTKIMLGCVLLALIIVPVYFFLPVEVIDTPIGRDVLLLCDFHVLPSNSLGGTTILEMRTLDGNVSLVLSKERFRSNLTGAIVKCQNSEILAISPTNGEGPRVISGDVVQMETTQGESMAVLFIYSIHEPLPFENWVSDNRFIIDWIVLIVVWLASSLVVVSFGRVIQRDVRRL
jgi:hypothetical protein